MKLSLVHWLKTGMTAGLLAASSGAAMAACGAETTISPIDDFSLTFKVCDNSFVGTVTAKATGWVAVGFSQDQYMPQTDVFMAGVLPDGTAYHQDAFAYFRSPPVADAQQSATLLSASESNGITRYTFSRPLKTTDADMDYDLTQGSYYILTAFNSISDATNERHSYADASDVAYPFAPVPEAQTLWMLLGGLGLVAGRLRWRRLNPR